MYTCTCFVVQSHPRLPSEQCLAPCGVSWWEVWQGDSHLDYVPSPSEGLRAPGMAASLPQQQLASWPQSQHGSENLRTGDQEQDPWSWPDTHIMLSSLPSSPTSALHSGGALQYHRPSTLCMVIHPVYVKWLTGGPTAADIMCDCIIAPSQARSLAVQVAWLEEESMQACESIQTYM